MLDSGWKTIDSNGNIKVTNVGTPGPAGAPGATGPTGPSGPSNVTNGGPNGSTVNGIGFIPRSTYRVPNWCVIDASGGFNDTGGGPSHNVNGTNAAQVDATGAYRRFTLGATSPNGITSNGGSGWSWGDYNPFAEVVIRTGSTITGAAGDAANYKIFFIITDSAGFPGNTSDLHTEKYIGIRYVEKGGAGSDPGWVTTWSDGTTQTVDTNAIASIATSTVYRLGLYYDTTNAQFYASVGASQKVVTGITNFTGHLIYMYCYHSTTTTTRTLDFKSYYLERD